MVPTSPEPGDGATSRVEHLSTEAAWGVRALIMVLMFLLRWVGREPFAGDRPTPTDPVDPGSVVPVDQQARAERVAKARARSKPAAAVAPSDATARDDSAAGAFDRTVPDPLEHGDAGAGAHRRRAVYASAVTAAGTVAWFAGRRSARR